MTDEIKNPMARHVPNIESRVVTHNLRKRKEIENLRPSFTLQIPSTLSVQVDLSGFGPRGDSSFFSESILDILCFALSRTYKKYPKVNSTFSDSKSYIEFDKLFLGIAFDEINNLKVLSLKNSEAMSLTDIQSQIINLLEIYSSGETIPLDLFNSTMTVTDLSSVDVAYCVPTLSMGQAAIIAITRPKNKNYLLTCTYDHQILEGKYIAEFLNLLKAKIISIYESISKVAVTLECSACLKTISEELEISNRNRGLIVLRNSLNEEILLCRVCFEGY